MWFTQGRGDQRQRKLESLGGRGNIFWAEKAQNINAISVVLKVTERVQQSETFNGRKGLHMFWSSNVNAKLPSARGKGLRVRGGAPSAWHF